MNKSEIAERAREQFADIIERQMDWLNGESVSEGRFREECEAAAELIVGELEKEKSINHAEVVNKALREIENQPIVGESQRIWMDRTRTKAIVEWAIAESQAPQPEKESS